jgi:hypothetical protein
MFSNQFELLLFQLPLIPPFYRFPIDESVNVSSADHRVRIFFPWHLPQYVRQFGTVQNTEYVFLFRSMGNYSHKAFSGSAESVVPKRWRRAQDHRLGAFATLEAIWNPGLDEIWQRTAQAPGRATFP